MAIKIIGGSGADTTSVIPDPIYGSGKDGNFTASANMSLTRDMYYSNLTINQNIHLDTNGYRVFVRNILMFKGDPEALGISSSLGLKNGSASFTGSLGTGSLEDSFNSLGGNSENYYAYPPSASFGGSDYFNRPEYAVEGYVLNASQTSPLALNGGAGDGTNSGGGVVVVSARRVSGLGTIIARGWSPNPLSPTETGGGVIVFCSGRIKPSAIGLVVSGYSPGTVLEYVV